MIRLFLILFLMAYPVYEDNGGAAAGTGVASVDVPYMGTIDADDILICTLLDADDDTFSAPSGWTKPSGVELTNANLSTVWMWKRATGSETGTETFTSAASTGNTIAGVMSRYSGCKTTGDPFEDRQESGITLDSSPIASAITTSGIERLVVNLVLIEDNTTISAGASGYTLGYNISSAVGDDSRLAMQYQEVATAQTVSEETATISVSEYWGSYTIALLPPGTGEDNLTSTDIETGNPDVEDATLGQTHILTGNDVETQNSEVVNATLGQTHILSSDDIAAQNPVIGTPTLQEIDVLEADNIETQNPVIENTTIGQIHALLSSVIESGSPIIENADLGQEHALDANDINTQAVVIGTPTLAEIGSVDNLIATDIETAAPIIQAALLKQIHDILTDDIETKNPIIGTPTFGENTIFQPFIKRERVCASIVDFETSIKREVACNNAYATFRPFINRIRCTPLTSTVSNPLVAASVVTGSPVIETSDIGQTHILNSDNIESQNVEIGSPEVAEVSPIPRNGLFHEILMDGDADDTSGNNLDGTPTLATLTTGKDGAPDTAYEFTASTLSRIDYGDPVLLQNIAANDFTFSIWINDYTKSSAALSTIWTSFGAGTVGMLIRTEGSVGQDNRKLRVDIFYSSSFATIESSFEIINGQFNNIIITLNYSTRTLHAYINGVEITYSTQNPGVGTLKSDVGKNKFHGILQSGSTAQTFDGKMSLHRFWDRILTAEEITIVADE